MHPTASGRGPLALFVGSRRTTALDLLVLAHALAPLADRGEITASSSEWSAAIGIADRRGARSQISRSWDWLTEQKFIESWQTRKLRTIKVLLEDGSGRPWVHPYTTNEPYFKLPNHLWQVGLWQSLELPAKAMLLIAISLTEPDAESFQLPIDRGARWYGLGTRTVRAGLKQLDDAGLLRNWSTTHPTARSPIGHSYTRRYALNSWKIANWDEPGQN